MYSFCLYENRSRCLETKKLNQFFIFFAAEGADSIDAGGGGGSEIHCPPGAGASMGHCEYSVSSALTMMIRLD